MKVIGILKDRAATTIGTIIELPFMNVFERVVIVKMSSTALVVELNLTAG